MATKAIDKYLKHLADLATISPVAVELITKVEDINASRDDIARLVKKDDVLYSNVFKLVNSAALGLARRPKNILEAINVIGMFQLRSLTFMIAAKKVFVDLELWYKSVFIAYTAENIAKQLGKNQNFQSDIYIAGLMLSVGELIFRMFYRDEYEDLLAITDYRQRLEEEKKIFEVSSLELSCEVVKNYGLPDALAGILQAQTHDWQSKEFKQENAILELARALSGLDPKALSDQDLIVGAINDRMLEKFSLDTLVIDTEYLAKLHAETKSFVNS